MWKSVRWTASTKARTCSSFIRTNASIAGFASPSAPAEAIKPDTEPGLDKWLQINTEYAEKWPNVTVKRDPEEGSEEYDGMEGKFEKFFSPNPGQGD